MKPPRSISLAQLSYLQLSELMLLKQRVTDAFTQGADDILSICLNYKILAEESKNQSHIVFAYFMLGEFNTRIENYAQAIDYYLFSIDKNKKLDTELTYTLNLALANCYEKTKLYDSSILYWEAALNIQTTALDWKFYHKIAIGYYLLRKGEKATAYLEKSMRQSFANNSNQEATHEYIETLLEISKILTVQKNYVEAEQMIQSATILITQHGQKSQELLSTYYLSKLFFEQKKFEISLQILMALFEEEENYADVQLFLPLLLLAELSSELGQFNEAFKHFENALQLSRNIDELALISCLNKYYEFLEGQKEYEKAYIILKELQEKTELMELAETANELRKARSVYENREQEIRLENLTAVNELNNQLIYRTNELEEKNVKLEKVRRELMEGQLLRSQMNPHFIYNSLNSISSLIKSDENEKADKYLLKFSKLTRNIFGNSTKEMVLLASEISIVKDYLEMEKLRFNNRFNYQLKIEDALSVNTINIPPMILQPIVENAIKHGIFHLGEKTVGNVVIEISNDKHPANHKEALKVSVSDNGVGLQEKTDFLSNRLKQSALFITIKRLRNFNRTEHNIQNLFYEVLEPHGTKFTLYIII